MVIKNDAVYLLTTPEHAKKKAFGTGFAVAHKDERLFIVTCAHVIEQLDNKPMIEGSEAKIEGIGSSETVDLALLSIPCESMNSSDVLNETAQGKENEKFQLCGYAAFSGAKDNYNLRNISGCLGRSSVLKTTSLSEEQVLLWDLKIDNDDFALLQRGHSGSPVCDKEGKLIAVVSHNIGEGLRGHAVAAVNLRSIYSDIKQLIPSFICLEQDGFNFGNQLELSLSEEFRSFLQNSEMLTKAHPQKKTVILDDIFVYPQLTRYDKYRKYDRRVSARDLFCQLDEYPKIIIEGAGQSGKTTLCKKIYSDLFENHYIPIYIFSESSDYSFHGTFEKKIENALKRQYNIENKINLDKEKIVIIIDDFHFANLAKKEKYINILSDYPRAIIIVDDIFNLNFRNEKLLDSFTFFKINELAPSLRNELIEKWVNLDDTNISITKQNNIYRKIDHNTELIDSTLGKVIGNGIMPAYPFFILSIITTYETFSTPLDQEITSQGYCYQALIYLYLRKVNVRNDEIDTYINFLTEFSFFFFSKKKKELSEDKFDCFMESYLKKYHLPVEQSVLLEKLLKSQLITLDNLGNYSFCYSYLYYFFVAKYLADNLNREKDTIDNIIGNLHEDKNAYIAIFISHHSKNNYILDEILLNADDLFYGLKPATLSKKELSFFDCKEKHIVKAMLPSTKINPEVERDKKLKHKDFVEENSTHQDDEESELIDDELAIDLRRSIKTVEVMGRIIKNRAGSLEKSKLEEIFSEGMRVHLRILSYFLDIIEREDTEKVIVDLITQSVKSIVDKQSDTRKSEGRQERKPSPEQLEKMSKEIFWNLNFFIIYSIIYKIVRSLGSRKLVSITEKICDKEGSPASFLVKHGILLWYSKNLHIESISKGVEKEECSFIAREIMRRMIVDHASTHQMNFKDRERISKKLGIQSNNMLKLKGKMRIIGDVPR